MFPKAPNGETHSSERPTVHIVSASVPLQLWNPIPFIRFGHVLVPRTRMVETTVSKNRKPQAWNQNIRLTGKTPHILINPPTATENATHACIQGGFGRGPATSNPGHYLAALARGENVHRSHLILR
jgi:hypothetical protein